LDGKCCIFADDATATQTQYIDTEIAGGTIIKMKQVGSLSDTLSMIHTIRELGMMQCVSHRSCETEDCFIGQYKGIEKRITKQDFYNENYDAAF
jgi:enolase